MLQVSAILHLASPQMAWSVHLIDISKAGVAFASARPLQSGTPFVLSFWLVGSNVPCTADGTIVYCLNTSNNQLYRMGAQFDLLSDDTLELIRDFVSSPHA